MRELGDGGWNLETLVQNNLLPLEVDVFGPVRSVWGRMSWSGPKLIFKALREKTTRQRTDTKVLGMSLKQRVLLRLGGLARTKGGRGGFLAFSGFGFGLVIETKSAMFILFFSREKEKTIALRSSNAVRTHSYP